MSGPRRFRGPSGTGPAQAAVLVEIREYPLDTPVERIGERSFAGEVDIAEPADLEVVFVELRRALRSAEEKIAARRRMR